MADHGFIVKPLSAETWPDFLRLAEKHNGVWGGCWCTWFHGRVKGSDETSRERKERLVCGNQSHAALVYDGPDAIGWCQFGRPDELPRIKHMRAYVEAATHEPDWRITCFFVDRDYRRRGVAQIALNGALDLIAEQGGGLVESFPADTTGRTPSASFLFNATLSMFERTGFQRHEKISLHQWLVTKRIEPKERG